MPRGVSSSAKEFKKYLDEGVLLVGGEGSVDLNDDDSVFVGIIVNVTGYGPHVGAIYVMQNRFHGNADEPLQEAHQILEEWEMDHNPDYFKELEAEYGERASEVFTETFDGQAWELSAQEFADAIEGTTAEKYIDVEEAEEEEDVEEGVLEEGGDEDVPRIRISFTRITRGDSEDSDDYEEEHGWIDEDGVEFEPDEDDDDPSDSIVSQAVDFLKKEGATNPSSSGFHSGIWYSTEYETTDYGTGEEEERSFHLKGFEPEEEAEIFKQMTKRGR